MQTNADSPAQTERQREQVCSYLLVRHMVISNLRVQLQAAHSELVSNSATDVAAPGVTTRRRQHVFPWEESIHASTPPKIKGSTNGAWNVRWFGKFAGTVIPPAAPDNVEPHFPVRRYRDDGIEGDCVHPRTPTWHLKIPDDVLLDRQIVPHVLGIHSKPGPEVWSATDDKISTIVNEMSARTFRKSDSSSHCEVPARGILSHPRVRNEQKARARQSPDQHLFHSSSLLPNLRNVALPTRHC